MNGDCERAREMLHDRLDDRLSATDSTHLERHLDACDGCRSDAAELEGLRAETLRLPREVEPRRDLWPAIERRLAPSWRQRWLGARLAGTLRQSAPLMAAAAAVLAFGLGFWLGRGETPSNSAPEAIRAAAPLGGAELAARNHNRAELARSEDGMLLAHHDLLTAVRSQSDRLSPETRAVVEENMNIIDQAIGQIRTALEDDPLNPRLNMLLAAQYQHEVELLKRVSGV
jgi:hypothetical protein